MKNPPIGGTMPCPPIGAGRGSCTAVMFPNRLTATAPLTALSFPGSGHTCVSCPHPTQLCLHSSPWTKNDCPSIPASANAETAGKSASNFAPLADPSMWKSPPWVAPSRSDEHGPVAHSIQLLRNRKTHILHEYWLHKTPLSRRSILDTGTSEPIQYDTDNAISCVITYGICSLLPPYVSMLRQQLDVRIAVSGLFGHSHPGPA